MANFTKGKWTVYTDGMTCATDIVAEDGVGFFTEIIAHIRRANKDYEANAHLIASAPDMYEALKALLPNSHNPLAQSPLHGKWEVDGNTLEKARLALAKAEGKE